MFCSSQVDNKAVDGVHNIHGWFMHTEHYEHTVISQDKLTDRTNNNTGVENAGPQADGSRREMRRQGTVQRGANTD